MNQIREWFDGLDDRDQMIALSFGVILSILLVYLLIFSPLNNAVSDLDKKVAAQEKTVEWMKQQVPLIAGNNVASNGNRSSLPLASLINTTTKQYSLPVSRRDSKSPNEMQIWFDNVSFNSFLKWSAEVTNKHGVTIISVNVRSRERNGITSVNVKLLK